MKGTITYERESQSGGLYTLEIEYEAHEGERATGPSYASGGDPGYQAHAEVYGVTCKELYKEGKSLCFAGQEEVIGRWFMRLIETDNKLRERINELCLEDASERHEAARDEAADAKREAMRERGWR